MQVIERKTPNRRSAPAAAAAIALLLALAALVLSAPPALGQGGDAAALAPEERSRALRLLYGSELELLQQVAGLSDAAWSYSPDPERWSVSQIVEHLVLAEGAFQGRVEKALAGGPQADWRQRTGEQTERLFEVVPDRGRKFQAPPVVSPRAADEQDGRGDLIAAYTAARERTLGLLETPRLKEHLAENVVFGELNAYQLLLLAGLHNRRHNEQVAELLASPGFPAGAAASGSASGSRGVGR